MNEELEIVDFCQKWIPKVKGLDVKRLGLRKCGCILVSRISSYQEGTVQQYYGKPEKTPGALKRLLYRVDREWLLRELLKGYFDSSQGPEDYLEDIIIKNL